MESTIDLPSDHQTIGVLHGHLCPYCGAPTVYVDSSEVYGRSYGMIYLCRPCRAWVGVHGKGKSGSQALGRLANAELRKWKQAAHSRFDSLWRLSTRKGRRRRAYAWLGSEMSLSSNTCHIGMMNVQQCQRVVQLCDNLVKSLSRK